jgi:hypothetical protein
LFLYPPQFSFLMCHAQGSHIFVDALAQKPGKR